MEQIKNLNIKKSKVFTREQLLAEDVWLFFSKRLPFPRLMKMIKDKGHQAVYESFNDVRKSNAKDKLALFIFKVKEYKILWQ